MIHYAIMFGIYAVLFVAYIISCRMFDKKEEELMNFSEQLNDRKYNDLYQYDYTAGFMRGDLYSGMK